MKKNVKKLLLILLAAGLLVMAAHAQEIFAYWINGGLADTLSTDGTTTISANGRMVIFYKNDINGVVYKPYATAQVAGNTFMINAYNIWPASLEVGATYQVATDKGADGYGANPVPVTISGIGWDEVKGLSLILGGGVNVSTEAPSEPAPMIKIWFGNRVYQKALVAKGQDFIISAKPDMKVELSIDPPYTLGKLEAQSIIVDEGTSASKTLSLTTQMVQSQVTASGGISSMSIKYTFTDALSDGKHTFTVNAASSGLIAPASVVAEKADVSVLGGPLQLIGTPICFPSPFSISKQKTVYIQYTLSQDANIDIYLISVAGERVKRFTLMAGAEGGSAGVNKVAWEGRKDTGMLAGNAIYVGTIIARDEGRLLGKVKMTLVD